MIDTENYDVISKDALINLFEAKVREDVKPVDNEKLLCIHKNLDMNASFKCISKVSADLIYTNYGGNPRITIPDFFCRECVNYIVKYSQVKYHVDNDSKRITSLLKFKSSENERMFWVGKESFKKWKQLRLNLIENLFNQNINMINNTGI